MTTELKPGDRVLIEAVAVTDDCLAPVLYPDGRPAGSNYSVTAVRWHHDDRAEQAAERDRLAAKLAEADLNQDDISSLTSALRDPQSVIGTIDRLRHERDEARAELERVKAERDTLTLERAEIRATAMRKIAALEARVRASDDQRDRLAADDFAIRKLLRDHGASVGGVDPLPAVIAETLDSARHALSLATAERDETRTRADRFLEEIDQRIREELNSDEAMESIVLRWLDALIAELDEARAQIDRLKGIEDRLRARALAAEAQVAAMREVVEAALAFDDAMATNDPMGSPEWVSAIFDAETEFRARMDAYRASQKATAEAPEPTLPDQQATDVDTEAEGATGTTEGSTALPTLVADPACRERFPECEFVDYDPRCCRFPKSCSPMIGAPISAPAPTPT